MIPYSRDPKQTISSSAVRIIGLGGAGANMLERIALDGVEGAELLALNTDVRTLSACIAKDKIQLGVSLTKGLGAGGDPELGHQAVLEAEDQIRAVLKGQRIVFLCAGLGGGTGSGAAPIVTRIAREEGAFVVVFATMPFAFEGKRRRDQAETSLNQLAVLSNALVTFDNNRMGELVLAKQGIHEAFGAADHMISESIKAVIRLVVRPGLINVGLDDLMSALRTNRSRCLFGSGIAEGKDRAAKALRNALASPLLDQGSLLKEAQSVLVHLCGGENLTLFEIELLMQSLQKFVPESAHVLFGAAVDPAMGDSLSLTLISALPEDSLAMAPRESLSKVTHENILLDSRKADAASVEKQAPSHVEEVKQIEIATPTLEVKTTAAIEKAASSVEAEENPGSFLLSKLRNSLNSPVSSGSSRSVEELPFAEPEMVHEKELSLTPDLEFDSMELPMVDEPVSAEVKPVSHPPTITVTEFVAVPEAKVSEPSLPSIEESQTKELDELDVSQIASIPKKRPPGVVPWNPTIGTKTTPSVTSETYTASTETEQPRLKLGVKQATPQSELSLDATPRGRFEGEAPNVFEGEDLDLPPFLRKKK